MTAAVGVWVPVRVAVRAWMGHYGGGGIAHSVPVWVLGSRF